VANAGGVTFSQVVLVQKTTFEAMALSIMGVLIVTLTCLAIVGNPAAGTVGICRSHCRAITIASANT
jgi:hypothetical protein